MTLIRVLRDDLIDPFLHWHRQMGGKVAIYGSLFFATLTLSNFLISEHLVPTTLRIPSVDFRAIGRVHIPCKVHGKNYLYGFHVRMWFTDGTAAPGTICRTFGNWESEYDISQRIKEPDGTATK
jgi:hypothetical protein